MQVTFCESDRISHGAVLIPKKNLDRIMPPGTAHCVFSTEPCLARGGHFLHDDLMHQTVAVNMLFRRTTFAPTNAAHNCVLQMFVARRVQRIMQRWRHELQQYCRHREMVKWASDDEPLVPPWPEQYPVSDQDLGLSPKWFALLYIVRYIAPECADQEMDRLPLITDQVANTVEKAELFTEFWTKRTRSTCFSEAIKSAAISMLADCGGQPSDVPNFPEVWQPAEGEYPASL